MGDKNTEHNVYISPKEEDPNATATIDQFHDNTDPKYIGPGTWTSIHKKAFKSKSSSQQLEFVKFMNETCNDFPCTVCRGHCQEYIRTNPISDYFDTIINVNGIDEKLGMFFWTWKFHNAVNHRLNKPIMSWDTAFNLYSGSESLVCSKACMNSALPPPSTNIKVPSIPIGTKSSFRLISKNSS